MSQFQFGPGKIIEGNTDPTKWNKAWDEYLEKRLQPRSEYPDIPPMSNAPNHPLVGQNFLSGLEESRKQLCKMQHDLTKLTTEVRTAHNFDAIWLTIPSEARENYILQGLVITCKSAADIEDRRLWCPETTMNFLQRDNGRGFLNLLITICTPHSSRVQPRSNPVFISHPVFDALIGLGLPCRPGENEAARIGMQNYVMIIRNSFITFMLWNTMLHIHGNSTTYTMAKVSLDKDIIRRLIDDLPEFEISKRKSMEAKMEAQKKEGQRSAEWTCSNCLTPESRLPDGRKLMECSKCKTVGRRVKYCDRGCQANDWKSGNPPHKTVCGRMYKSPDAFQTTVIHQVPDPSTEAFKPASESPPPPDPGYTRSEALLHQVQLMQKHHGVEYFLMAPDDMPDVGIKSADIMSSPSFKAYKDQAMKNGDPQSVVLMHCSAHLKNFARQNDIPQTHLLRQLSTEYKIDVETLTGLIQEA